mgnify:CR=1 FL=1
MHRLSLRCGGKCRPFSISHKRRHTVQTAFRDVPKSHPRPLPMLFLVPKGTIHRVTASLFPQKHAPRRMTAFLSKKEGTIHRVIASLFSQKHAPRRMTAFLCKKEGTIHRMTAPLFPQKHAPRRMTVFLSKKESMIHHVTASFFFQKCYHLVRSISHLKISYNLNHESPLYFLIHYQHPIYS